MKVSKAGLDLIKSFEGFSSKAYPDPATGGKPYTIGHGTTVYPDGKLVKLGDICTAKQAEQYLIHDCELFEATVNKCAPNVNQNQFDALVSLCYNIGSANLQNSTLIKKLNRGDIAGAADEFLKWNKAAGRVMVGLTRRRQAERKLFLS